MEDKNIEFEVKLETEVIQFEDAQEGDLVPEKYYEIYKCYKEKDYKNCLFLLSETSEQLVEYKILKSACLIHLGTRVFEAHEMLDNLLAKSPENPYTIYAKGLAHFHEKNYKESIECFEKARYLDPSKDMERAEFMIEQAEERLCGNNQFFKQSPSFSNFNRSPTSDQKVRRFGCEICNHFFGKKFNLDRHNRSIHSRSTPLDFPTKQKRSELSPLVSSKVSHTKLKAPPVRQTSQQSFVYNSKKGKVKCPTCHHMFKKSSIARHLIIHSGNKPHKCNECTMAFFQKSDLCRHQATHSDELKFECELCDRKFRIKKNLQVHKRRHHL